MTWHPNQSEYEFRNQTHINSRNRKNRILKRSLSSPREAAETQVKLDSGETSDVLFRANQLRENTPARYFTHALVSLLYRLIITFKTLN